ncbi:MAG: hypothetical protein GF393_02820 [Armatimonadia bacterium]|nr:hypothetical protein [Armatimonadia bacterium]
MLDERKKPSRFPETRWSLVGRAAASDEMVRRQALADLLTVYMPGLRAFLVEARRIPTDLADDMLHGFVADKILGAQLVRHADQGRGKFRNFVLKSLNNYVTTRLRKESAARAATIGLDEALLHSCSEESGSDQFDKEWVQQVVRNAIQLMERECRDRGRSDLWEVFRLRVVEPILYDKDPIDYGTLVDRFELETPRQAMNLLASAKRCFNHHLRSAVGRYITEEAEIDHEIADLRRIAAR